MVSAMDLSFGTLSLTPALLKAVAGLGYEQMTPIQAASIPPLLEGHDLVGQSHTGSGKTAAFVLPTARVSLERRALSALVLCPTRELKAIEQLTQRPLTRTALVAETGEDAPSPPLQREAKIEIHDNFSYVAVSAEALKHLSRGRIKANASVVTLVK